jgi:hypothetical protein
MHQNGAATMVGATLTQDKSRTTNSAFTSSAGSC